MCIRDRTKSAPSETRPIRAFAQGLVAETAKFYGTKEERDLLAIQEAELQEQARMRNLQKIDKLTRELYEANRRNEQYKPQKLSRNPTASSITGDMEQEVPTPWSSAEENEPPDGSKTPPRQRPWGFPGGSPGGGPPGGGPPEGGGGGPPPPPPPSPDDGTLAVLSQTVSLLARVIDGNLGKDTQKTEIFTGKKSMVTQMQLSKFDGHKNITPRRYEEWKKKVSFLAYFYNLSVQEEAMLVYHN